MSARDAPVAEAREAGRAASRSYLRGSSLLLGGRFISIALNFAVQVLTVRYLSQSDYGAFAYALGMASLGSSVLLMGLGKATPRFLPIYLQRGEPEKAFGTLALGAATIWGLGLAVIVLIHGFRGALEGAVVTDPLSMSLLLVLIALAPINAFDKLLQHTVAVFAHPRAIFFRRHVLGPGLKLCAVLLVIGVSGRAALLAWGYIVGGVIGIWLYVAILIREWRKQGLLRRMKERALQYPVREIFGFSLPLLTSELPVALRGALAIFLLEFFHDTTAVAEYRALLPLAGMNMVVFEAFALLFVPVASTMFARGEGENIRALYWRTSIWMAVLSFPVFAVTFALAEPITTFLFGIEYAGTGILLAILSLGFYLHAAIGFNAATLRVHGKVRFIVAADVLAAVVFAVLSVLLIPRMEALGAAISTTAALMAHNLFNQIALRRAGTDIGMLDSRFAFALLLATGSAVALALVQWIVAPPLLVGAALALVLSLALIRLTRHLFEPLETFPELLRIPLVRRLLT